MFKTDFIDGQVIEWSRKGGKTVDKRIDNYKHRFYIGGSKEQLIDSRAWINSISEVEATCFKKWKPDLSSSKQDVLRVDILPEFKTSKTARKIIREYGRTRFRYYNVGISPQFQYCIQKNLNPVPDEELEKIEIQASRRQIGNEDLSEIRINGEEIKLENKKDWKKFYTKYNLLDPDIIIVNRGKLLRILEKRLQELDESLARTSKIEYLAGENTVSSYGKTVHSSARYNLPGRIVIDRSNSFMLKETGVKGMWDLVARSYRPLQELAWASIGRILTSIEIKKAYLEQRTLTPWKNWLAEQPKKASKMHKADRGGFIFSPEPEIHRNVYEVDFASLFPNIMVEKNISPETVNCSCCSNSRTPELDYNICEKQKGFIPKVIKPLVDDRQQMKEKIENTENPEKEKYYRDASSAIKWILVSCFGYMGHAHASYGSIECHQAIQAFDRKIMVDTKQIFEENGYEIVHGIIDSLWVRKIDEKAPNIEEMCEKTSEEIGIELEFEHFFNWIAFTSRKSSTADIATLNRYFGKTGEEEFVKAGIETEQSSCPEYVKEAQEKMLKVLDKTMNPDKVCDVAQKQIKKLEKTQVEIKRLTVEKNITRELEDYKVENLNTSAIRRARLNGFQIKPGQKASYIVRDRDAAPREKVRLEFEAENYDEDFYSEKIIEAAESILSPFSWDRSQVEQAIKGYKKTSLRGF